MPSEMPSEWALKASREWLAEKFCLGRIGDNTLADHVLRTENAMVLSLALALNAAEEEGTRRGALNVWEAVFNLAASGTPGSGILTIAKSNADALRSRARGEATEEQKQ